MAKYARRPAPSPVELGIAARFLAPQRPRAQKSILSPVQRDLPPGVRRGEGKTGFRAPRATGAAPAGKFRGPGR
jgi:hypothetical protein